jgi:hypothetical protein
MANVLFQEWIDSLARMAGYMIINLDQTFKLEEAGQAQN